MRGTPLQWTVILAAFAMLAAAVLDIMGIIAPPDWVWIVVPIALGVIGWLTLPTMAQMKKAGRRRG